MRRERWWSVILTMGLFMALSPLSSQAGPNRPFALQPNRQAFTQPRPNANAYGSNGQNRQGQQPYGNAYGWNGQNRQWFDHRNDYWRDDHGIIGGTSAGMPTAGMITGPSGTSREMPTAEMVTSPSGNNLVLHSPRGMA